MSIARETIQPLIEAGQTALHQPAIGALKAQAISMLAAVDMSHPADTARILLQQGNAENDWKSYIADVGGLLAVILSGIAIYKIGRLISESNGSKESVFSNGTHVVLMFNGEAPDSPVTEQRSIGWNMQQQMPDGLLEVGEAVPNEVDILVEVTDVKKQIAKISYYLPKLTEDEEDIPILVEETAFLTLEQYQQEYERTNIMQPHFLGSNLNSQDEPVDVEGEIQSGDVEETVDLVPVVAESPSQVHLGKTMILSDRRIRQTISETKDPLGSENRVMVQRTTDGNTFLIERYFDLDISIRPSPGTRGFAGTNLYPSMILTIPDEEPVELDDIQLLSRKLKKDEGSIILRWKYDEEYEGVEREVSLIHGNAYQLQDEQGFPTAEAVVVEIIPDLFIVKLHHFDLDTRQPVLVATGSQESPMKDLVDTVYLGMVDGAPSTLLTSEL